MIYNLRACARVENSISHIIASKFAIGTENVIEIRSRP